MARKVYYKVQIGKAGRHSKFLRTEFKKKSTAKVAAKRFAHARVVKRRHVTHKGSR